MTASDLTQDVIENVAAYCAFRLHAFKAQLTDLGALQQMAEHNAQELGIGMRIRLELKQPVIADSRM
jgi:hypothetical protein